jgi:site-specific DNA recombinase
MRKITKIEQSVPEITAKKKVAAYARVSMESERMNHSLSAQISYYNSVNTFCRLKRHLPTR